MYPVHNVDAVLLLAIALSAKRRPAELVEIIAANDLIQGQVSAEAQLAEAFQNLSMHGLISQIGDGYVLTQAAQQIMAAQRKKADNEERLMSIKSGLAAYNTKGEHPVVLVPVEQLSAAMLAHQASKEHAGKNLLVPKPKPVVDAKRPGRRKPLPSRRKY